MASNIPETVMIRTMDNELVEMSGKVANECRCLRDAFSWEGFERTTELELDINSQCLKHVMKLLELYDLDRPYLPPMSLMAHQRAHNEDALTYMKNLEYSEVIHVIDGVYSIGCERLADTCTLFSLTLVRQSDHKVLQLYGFENNNTFEEEEKLFTNFVTY